MFTKDLATEHSPKIGIISDSSLHRHTLKNAVCGSGYQVAINVSPERFSFDRFDHVDAWIVDVSDIDQWDQLIDDLLDRSSAPVLFGEGEIPNAGQAEYPIWERRMFSKLIGLVGRAEPTEHIEVLESLPEPKNEGAIDIPLPIECVADDTASSCSPDRIWVLGASLGGPAAVKIFLDCLPKGFPVAFVYAQHINEHFQGVLAQVLGRHSHFKLQLGQDRSALQHGCVLVAPVEYEIGFSVDGRIVSQQRAWDGPYTPSIDQVVRNVARCFGTVSGAIIFSGMGNDGAIGCPDMLEKGGIVWAQSPESCDASSMPESVIATGCTSFVGTPQQLAEQLVEHVRQSMKIEPNADASDILE